MEHSQGKIAQCYNHVEEGIYAEYSICGGVVGASVGSIEDCYNSSKVRGQVNVGGICGSQWQPSTWTRNVYNQGNIIGQSSAGGIIGFMAEISCNNFINIGVVDKTSGGDNIGDIVGYWGENVTWENGTWLDSTSTTENTIKNWSDLQIKSYLGNNFTKDTKGVNGGLPILTWQADATVH